MLVCRCVVLIAASMVCLCVGAFAGYTDRWGTLASDGRILAARTLLHPYVNEQPFTRSLSGVKIPDHVNAVTVRAHGRGQGHGTKVVAVGSTGRP